MPAILSDSPSAILVVGPSWVGDMVMAQSLFMTLKAQDGERAIDVLAPGWTRARQSKPPPWRACACWWPRITSR
mgnify:CR=1 FL=1